ncbi:hypothetical protein ACN28C_23220 [Plantactinospora sp. WMMC1484]|uniref:hypothetical protein n=1 Tax=Plantactinospora sp. WMMC1484 TaxID=3404122 RepID=UPI003BF4E193
MSGRGMSGAAARRRAAGGRTARILLVGSGVAMAAYGIVLLPPLDTVLPWLLAGPLLHDALLAPLVGLAGVILGRLVPDRATRSWIAAGLTMPATLLLIAVPLLWRPAAAASNPGLQDRDYLIQIGVWTVLLWSGLAAGYRLWRSATTMPQAVRSDRGPGRGGRPDRRRAGRLARPADVPRPDE